MDNLLLLGGVPDIGKVMSSTGPVVKCVLLRCSSGDNNNNNNNNNDDGNNDGNNADGDKKVAATTTTTTAAAVAAPFSSCSDNDTHRDHDLNEHLIDEILVDTTPRKSMVSQILGGPFTFLGQYEDEGIIVMIRRPDENWDLDDDDDDDDDEDDNHTNTGKHVVISTLLPPPPPINPHKLQPPLHNVVVRGDILLMKVAEIQDEDDNYDHASADTTTEAVMEDSSSNDQAAQGSVSASTSPASPEMHMLSNEEFFLDYTREEYLKFASRTDIVADEENEDSDDIDDEGEYCSEEEDGDDEDAQEIGDDNEDDEEEDEEDDEDMDNEANQVGMMNMILGHLLSKFREQNGRGPDSLELLEMRKALADKLGVEVPPVNEEACDWGKKLPPSSSSPSSPGMSEGKRKHNKKVVVAEEMNETEEIPSRRCRTSSEDEDDAEVEEEEAKETCIIGRDEDVDNRKQPAQDVDDDETMQPQQKKIKVNGMDGKRNHES